MSAGARFTVIRPVGSVSYTHLDVYKRQHQIRVHLSSIGHPLAGDDFYGGSRELISRQALHCGLVELTHPFFLSRICVKAPFPNDFKKILEFLNIHNQVF